MANPLNPQETVVGWYDAAIRWIACVQIMSVAASFEFIPDNIIDYRHVPDGEPKYGYTNDSFNGDTLQVRMSALPQDSGLSARKSDVLYSRSISSAQRTIKMSPFH